MDDNNAASIGFQVWLAFMAVFALMGYPIVLSATLGAIAGFFAGLIRFYVDPENLTILETKKDPPPHHSRLFNLDRFRRKSGERAESNNRGRRLGRKRGVQTSRKR